MLTNGADDADASIQTFITVGDGHGFEARVEGRPDDDVVVVVTGEIDLATAGWFREAVDDACRRAGRLVVDLSKTTYIDSSGLDVLVRAHDRLSRRPGAVVVRAPSPGVRQILGISGLDIVLRVEPDEPSP